MGFFVWLLFVIIFISIKMGKISVKGNGKETQQRAQGRTTASRPQSPQRSFAAMPKSQQKAVPNVERNCSADDKQRHENNTSVFNKEKTNATPNVPNSNVRPQPRMTGNRKAARQLYIGDPIPKGMRVVRCSYCAADNLVPYTARNEYKCYFCHYDI